MLYTVLPGLTLCMTLMKGNNSNIPSVNVPADSAIHDNSLHYGRYLDAAMILIQAAKQMKIREESISREDTSDESKSESISREDTSDESKSDDVASLFPELTTDAVDTGNAELVGEPQRCPSRPIDCEELLIECSFTTSGIYRIWPHSRVDTGGDAGFDVFCDMDTDGGGWTVFQRRDDFGTGSDFFFQNWLSYKYGFGHLKFDFWLGNDKIFALSNQKKSMLRVDVVDFEDETGYATYDNFYLDDEDMSYRLHIGDYRGNIGDSLRGHNLCSFSTKDRDNDRNIRRNCAQVYKGGWWYNNCHTANLNGLYLKGDHDSYANGVNWHSWRGFRHSLKKTEMKLRSSTFRKFPNDVVTQIPIDQTVFQEPMS